MSVHLPESNHPPRPIPGPLRGAETGTFAHKSVVVRLPEIGRRTLLENDFPPEKAARVQALIAEIPGGRMRLLHDDLASDWSAWFVYCTPFLGMDWLEVPWFFVENYFYRRMLEATGYFQPGPGQYRDPFAMQKRLGLETNRSMIETICSQWKPEAVSREPPDLAFQLSLLLASNLWGNQADLSLWPVGKDHKPGEPPSPSTKEKGPDPDLVEGMPKGQVARQGSRLVIDDSARLAAYIAGRGDTGQDNLGSPYRSASGGEELRLEDGRGESGTGSHTPLRVDFLLDNAGLELVNDLLLADFLLTTRLAREVRLHAKAHPTFVSDALPLDVLETVEFLAKAEFPATRSLGMRLKAHLEAAVLRLRSHYYWNSPLAGWEMPADLKAELASSGLLVSKGDANYRRLLGDRHWPLEISFAAITGYLPAPLASLRVYKSEVAVGLAPSQAEKLFEADPDWMIDGNWGSIQFPG